MILDAVSAAAFLGAAIYTFVNAEALAQRPRRGTALRPSKRWWRVVSALLLVGALGSLSDLLVH